MAEFMPNLVSSAVRLRRAADRVPHTAHPELNIAKNWINGQWLDSDKHTNSFDPATGERIGSYADATQADAEAAIETAVKAFEETDWKENRRLRARVLNQMADRFEARREDLIQILSLENGKVRADAAFEVDMIPSKFRFWAAATLTS